MGGSAQLHYRGPRQGRRSLSPTLGSPAPGHALIRQAPRIALKVKRAYPSESQRAVGDRNSTLKGHACYLTCSETQCGGNHLKESWSNPLADLGEPPGEAGGNHDKSPANINPGSSHFWKLILPSGWQVPFWSALSRGLWPEAYLSTIWSVQLLRTSSLSNQLLRDPALYTNEPSSFCMGQDLEAKKTLNIFFFF